jgi:nitrate reductase NapE component
VAQQPVVVRQGSSIQFSHRLLFLVIAIVIFVVLAIIYIGDASFKYETALGWAGFAFFAASFL